MDTLFIDRATQIGSVLESVITLSRALASPRMTPFGDAVLTRTQLEILFVLAHETEPVAPGRLAATLRVTPGAITQTMDQLRDQDLVEQSPSGLDGRVRVWRLTDAAATQVAAFEAATVLRTTPWFTSLSPDELDTLAALISRVEVA
ncbi:MarR family winged helix-turn-helix transcriptional regulator [Cryobacterium sp. SO1]|uniref:MarR family winged helix-turn-helix transcriptional regulator n=1 Tax=Cryobacterium sp. SO1 TaxID=1897061 RepID=UPI0010E17A07|nr:MarR family winged helix-turn-helix transcriptional regulator [Cryobacterium sp. SO1]RZI34826.1 Transcriptional regulator ZitR [Cryobacterium sp. SO1]